MGQSAGGKFSSRFAQAEPLVDPSSSRLFHQKYSGLYLHIFKVLKISRKCHEQDGEENIRVRCQTVIFFPQVFGK